VRKSLERRAQQRPLALAVDDIHWAEPMLLELLEHLVDWTRDAPLLLVCLARPELLDHRPGWARSAQGDTMTLQPLSEAQTDELIDRFIAGAQLPQGTRARIRETAGGNPLFVEQLLAVLAERGEAGELPPTIHALLAARLDGLPDEERDVLERASIVGLEFEWEALAAISPDGHRPPGARLATLVRKELIRPHEALADAFRFRHILIRDAAYERIPKDLRAELHERFADWLERSGEEFEEIVGYHLEQAYRSLEALGSRDARARTIARRAAARLAGSGRRARARGDALAAGKLLERAAALLPADDPLRLELLPPLGQALRASGDSERAETVLAEATERGRAAGEPGVAAEAAIQLADLRLHRTGQTGVGRAEVWREIEAATSVFEQLGDEAGMARAIALAGRLRFWKGEAAASLHDEERAARLARSAGDRGQEAECLRYALSAMLYGPMPVDDALRRCDGVRAHAASNRRLGVSLCSIRSQLEAMRGHFDRARELIAEARALEQGLGLPFMIDVGIAPAVAFVELLAGDAAAAEAVLRPACDGLEQTGELGFLSTMAYFLAQALAAQSRDADAYAVTERWRPDELTVPEDVDAHVGWGCVRATLLARRGDLVEAERLARAAVDMASDTDFLYLRAGAHATLAEVLRLAGSPSESAASLAEAIRRYEQKGNVVAAAALLRP